MLEMKDHSYPYFGNHAKSIIPDGEMTESSVTMEKGDVLFFDGYLVHGSYENKSASDNRPAYIAHYVPKGSLQDSTKGDRVSLHGERHRVDPVSERNHVDPDGI